MDWTQTLTVIGINAAFFLYLMSRMDNNQKQTNERFNEVNDKLNTLENRMTSMESDIKHTNQRLSDFQTQVNQRFNTLENYIIPKKIIPEEPKEN